VDVYELAWRYANVWCSVGMVNSAGLDGSVAGVWHVC
jgi:hypothetical protein